MRGKLKKQVYDIVVIGAGVVGCAMARRFTLNGARVAIIEKGPDILDGASKANSAILHTGFDAPPGSVEHGCIRDGYTEYLEIHRALGLPLDPSAAHVVAWNDAQVAKLDGILDKAHENGATDARMISSKELQSAEPNLSKDAKAAILVPGECLIDPWSAPYIYLQQALDNGADVFTGCEVSGGAFDGRYWHLETSQGDLDACHVINCAGLYGDLVDQAILGKTKFRITPRKGQFVVYDKAASSLARSIILPVPTERTKGVVVCRTIFGNLLVGPTAEDQEGREDASTQTTALQELMKAGERILPGLKGMPVTAAYAGLRPASEFKDYQISAEPARNWITVGGIRSTGLSAALGIARYVYKLYTNQGVMHDPISSPNVPFAKRLSQNDPRDWQDSGHGGIVCHCEMVTEREVHAALSGPLAAKSMAGLKRQTRVTMGRCQGFFCSARLSEITAGKFKEPFAKGIADD
jgi:glycerol-3-phosphate dehydrogenase